MVTDRQCERVPDGGVSTRQKRVVINNPTSGDERHTTQVRRLATAHGFTVLDTEREGHAVELAATVAEEGAEVVAAAGGDGTLNEVVRGLLVADALDDVLFGVIPSGTGNNFAGNIGITDIAHGFEVLTTGAERIIDLGFAGDRPFLNSCVGGLTAEASENTSSSAKAELGVVAYVLSTVRAVADFEGTRLRIETKGPGERTWEGTVTLLLVGNGRCFPTRGQTQADMEDGLLDVALIEETGRSDIANLARTGALERLLGADSEYVTRLKTPALSVRVLDDDPAPFSLDGEMIRVEECRIETRPSTLRLRVGDRYEPHPG